MGTGTSGTGWDSSAVAQRIKSELEVAHHRGFTSGQFAKVTSLLHAFRTEGSSTEIATVERELLQRDVLLPEHLQRDVRFDRTGVVRLRLNDPPEQVHPHADREVRASTWAPGAPPSQELPIEEWLSTAQSSAEGAIKWFDVAPQVHPSFPSEPHRRSANTELDSAAQRVHAALVGDLCPGLTPVMARDLVSADARALPTVDTYGNEDGPRSLSVAAAVARANPSGLATASGDRATVAGAVILQSVQMLVGRDWIITSWPPSITINGQTDAQIEAPLLRQPFLSRVHHQFAQQQVQATTPAGPGDLALFLMHAMVETYGATHRMMQGWLADWEVNFYTRLGDTTLDSLKEPSRDLDALLALVAETRRRVAGLQQAREETRDHSWVLPAGTPLEQARTNPPEHVERIGRELQRHDRGFLTQVEAIRADMDVVVMRSAAAQQASSDALQRNLGLLTSVVLVPGLIAGFFGANTALPGGGTWRGFIYMVVAMALSVLIATAVWWRHELRAAFTQRRRRSRLRRPPKQ